MQALQQKVRAYEALNGGRTPGGTAVSPSAGGSRHGGGGGGFDGFTTPSRGGVTAAGAPVGAATAAAVAHAVADANLALSAAKHELEASNRLNTELQQRVKQLQDEALLLEDQVAVQQRRASAAETELRSTASAQRMQARGDQQQARTVFAMSSTLHWSHTYVELVHVHHL